jgi:hypothetical protein
MMGTLLRMPRFMVSQKSSLMPAISPPATKLWIPFASVNGVYFWL